MQSKIKLFIGWWHQSNRKIMGAFYLVAGIYHFVNPGFYLPLIPNYLPWPHLINASSGGAEIVLALGLFFRKTSRMAAFGICTLLILFVPAHVWLIQCGGCADVQGLCVPLWVAWVRLIIIQPLLFLWAAGHCRKSGH